METQCFLYDRCNHKDCNNSFCLRHFKLDSLYKAALISDTQRKHIVLRVDPGNTDLPEFKQLAEIEKDILNFVKEGKNLYLFSTNCGNGKTSWSLRLAEAYLNKIWVRSELGCKVLFISVPRLISEMYNNISKKSDYLEYINTNILTADLVIWDDIATKTGTDYELTKIIPFISNRLDAGKSNIYTSNLGPDTRPSMAQAVGDRLASRICNASVSIELHGADKRFLAVK